MTFEFEHSWIFLLAVLPYFIHRYLPAYETKKSAIHVSFFDVLVDILGVEATKSEARLSAKRWQTYTRNMTWGLLVIAMAKPVWLGEPQTREVLGRDVMVVVDLSGSMAEKDFSTPQKKQITRLDALKKVLYSFSDERQGDRLGLILFGDSAYLQAPFTADHEAWKSLLEQTRIAMAGESTHIGDAIGLGIKTFSDESQSSEKVMLLLTDGNDTDSLVPPIEAAKIARQYGIRIHVIAMGSPETVGESKLDIEVLDQIAGITGGESFLAQSPSELHNVHRVISELEPARFDSFTYQNKESLHYIPLIIIVLNALVMMLFYSLKIGWKVHFSSIKQGERNEH